MLSELEQKRPEIIHTPFGIRAKELIAKKISPEAQPLAITLIEAIDKAGINGLKRHESKENPGVFLPYSVIEVGDIRKQINKPLSEPNLPPDIYVIFPGFGVVPPRAWPFMSWDMAIDRAIVSLISRRPTKIIVMGTELGIGGTVTPQWQAAVKEKGFNPLATMFGEIISHEVGEKEINKLVLNGMSFGGLMARLTAAELPKQLLAKASLLLDNPVGDQIKPNVPWLRGLQIALGFMSDGLIRALFNDPIVTTRNTDEKNFSEALKQRRDFVADSSDQEKLKQKVMETELMTMLLKGQEQIGKHDHTHIRRGIFDPTTLGHEMKRHKSERHWRLKTSHAIYRLRPKRWQKVFDRLMSL